MFCDQCGKFNSPENEFCYNCGSPLVPRVYDPADSPVMVGAELTATALGKTENPVWKETGEHREDMPEVHGITDVVPDKVLTKTSETADVVPEKIPETADAVPMNALGNTPETADTGMQNTAEKADSRIMSISGKTPEKTGPFLPDTQEKNLITGEELREKPVIEPEDEQAETESENDTVLQEADASAISETAQERDEAEKDSVQVSSESEIRAQTGSSRERKIFLIIELIIMAVAAGTLGYLLHINYGPEQDARTYLCSRLTGDWEKAYGYLDIGEDASGLLSTEMYEKVMEQTPSKGFSDLSLTEVTDPAVLSVEAGIQEELSSGEKAYKAVYFDLDDGEQKTEYVLMEKSEETYALLFHRWKVSVSDLCVSDLTVTVHEGTTLTLNGCTIASTPENDQANVTDTYKIDRLFKGSYAAELTMENGESGKEEFQIDSSGTAIDLSEAELYPDQTLMDQVLEQFVSDYQAILIASLNGADFSEIQNYFAENAISEGRAQTMYENACSQAYTEEKGSGILKIELSDISAKYVSWKKSKYASAGDLVMEVSTTMSYTYTEDGGQTQKSDVKTSVGLLCYHQEDGQWKIQSFS